MDDTGQRKPSDLDRLETLPALLQWRIAGTPHGEAYRRFDAHAGRWVT